MAVAAGGSHGRAEDAAWRELPGWLRGTVFGVGHDDCVAISGPVLLSPGQLGAAIPDEEGEGEDEGGDGGGAGSNSHAAGDAQATAAGTSANTGNDAGRGAGTGAGSSSGGDSETRGEGEAGAADGVSGGANGGAGGASEPPAPAGKEVLPAPGGVEVLSVHDDGRIRIRAWMPHELLRSHEWVDRRHSGRFPAVLCLHSTDSSGAGASHGGASRRGV